MRRVLALVFVATIAVAIAAVALAAPSPKAVRASIVAAALAQKSVHWTEAGSIEGEGRTKWTSDVTRHSGTQWGAFNPGTDVAGKAHILFVKDTVYVQGDPQGLQDALYLTEAQATKYAGQWISIPKGDKLYAETAEGLTLASIVHDFTPRGKLKVVRWKWHGTRRLTLRTSRRGVAYSSLSAHASGKPLPIRFTAYFGKGNGFGGRFSKWNERVHVRAPASSTPIATVRGG